MNDADSPTMESAKHLQAPSPTALIPRRRFLTPTRFVYFLSFSAAVGGFLFGYDTGVIAGAMPLIERDVDFWGEKDSG